MPNNPFEIDDKKQKRNPFETNSNKRNSGFIVSLIIVVAIFVIIYNINIFVNKDTTGYAIATQEPLFSFGEDDDSYNSIENISSSDQLMSFEDLAANGFETTLSTDISQECFITADDCSKYYSGNEFEPGLYTITMYYDTEDTDVDGAVVELEFDLSDYFGINHDTLSDYFDFDVYPGETITVQNIPLQPGSTITAHNQLSDDKVSFELTPQNDTIAYDFNNPIPGLYVADKDIDQGTYDVIINGQNATQMNSLEYIPTTYEGDEYTFLYEDGDELVVDEDSAIMYYDNATTIKQV